MELVMKQLDQLAGRIDRLERQNRRLRRMLGSLLGAAGLIVLIAAQQGKPQSVEVEKLVVRDAQGKARIQMEVGTEGPIVRLLDEGGTHVASLSASAEAFVIRFFEPRNRLRTGMALQKSGVALVYYDKDGKAQTGRNAMLLGTGVFPAD